MNFLRKKYQECKRKRWSKRAFRFLAKTQNSIKAKPTFSEKELLDIFDAHPMMVDTGLFKKETDEN